MLELCLNQIDGDLVATETTVQPLPQSDDNSFVSKGNQECTNDLILPMDMDNPLLDNFTDLTSLIDSSVLASLSFPLEPQSLESFDFSKNIIDLESPSSIIASSPFSTSPSTPDFNVVPSSPSPLERKRLSSSDTIEPPVTKKPSLEKYVERRKKNNTASQVSRAKRRRRNVDLFVREKQLEEENAKLRIKAEEMSKEAERLKKLLIEQLAH